MAIQSEWDKVLVTHLKADAALMAAVNAVYAGVADQTVPNSPASRPYIVLEDSDFLENDTAGETGFEVFTQVVTYSWSKSRKEILSIMDLIYSALHRQQNSLSVAGYSVLFIDRERAHIDDPVKPEGSWKGRSEFRALVMKD